MNPDDIAIHVGKVDFAYEPIRRIEASCEAASAFSSAPSITEVNARLKALAAKLGANAIIEAEYDSGVSWTSWRAMKGRGLAVMRVSDEIPCPVCAEIIKRAAIKCRYCGSDVKVADWKLDTDALPAVSLSEKHQEPLRSSDAMPIWVWVLFAAVIFGSMLIALGSG